MAASQPGSERLATAAGPADGRAPEVLRVLRRVVGFGGAWVSVFVGSEDVSLASEGFGRLVDGAFAGVVVGDDGAIVPLPDLPGLHGLHGATDDLLRAGSDLHGAVRAQPPSGQSPTTFLWPHDEPATPHGHSHSHSHSHSHGHGRVTAFAFSEGAAPGVRGIVLLSPPPDLCGLTRRELEVLGCMLDGSSNDQIARALVVTSRTVATHVEHILVKLSSPSRTHAAVRAQREGLYVPSVPSAS